MSTSVVTTCFPHLASHREKRQREMCSHECEAEKWWKWSCCETTEIQQEGFEDFKMMKNGDECVTVKVNSRTNTTRMNPKGVFHKVLKFLTCFIFSFLLRFTSPHLRLKLQISLFFFTNPEIFYNELSGSPDRRRHHLNTENFPHVIICLVKQAAMSGVGAYRDEL